MKPIVRNIIIGCIILAVAVGGGNAALRGYQMMRQTRLIKQAREYLAKNETRKAALCVQRVLKRNIKSIEACRLMAQILERGQSPQAALVWLGKVVEYHPGSTEDRLELARAALTIRDYTTATNALRGVSAQGKKTLVFQNLAGTVAAAMGNTQEAERSYLEAARLDPKNLVPIVNVSILRLQSTNEQRLAEARSTLRSVTTNPTNGFLRCNALRELALDALHHGQNDDAMMLSDRLVQDTNSTFSDRLLRLDVLAYTTNAQLSATFEAYQREAATNSAKAYDLASWQFSMLGPSRALAWLKTLPANIQTNQPVALLEAECYDVGTDGHALQVWLQTQNWGELEFLRCAFLTRALRKQELTDSAKAEWEQALKAANSHQVSLAMLLKLAAQWKMDSEEEDILWIFVTRYPNERWAVDALGKTLYLGGRTREIMSLCDQQAKRNPGDFSNKNNLAATALLLNAQEIKPHDLAREVYEKSPTNASFASTYAFSLYLQKKNNEALRVIEKLNSNILEQPTIAGYYGLILKATGKVEKANTYFAYAFKARLLPEEKKLFEKARSGA